MQKKIWTLSLCLFVAALFIGVAFAATKLIKADEGGSVKLSRGVYLEIRPHSLNEDTKIHAHMSSRTIKYDDEDDEDDEYDEDDEDDDEGYNQLFFEFGPSGTEFYPDAKLHIPLDLLVEDDIEEIAIYNEDGELLDAYISEINDAEELIVEIPHFSYYYYRRR